MQYLKISDVFLENHDGWFFRITDSTENEYCWNVTTIDFTEGGKKTPEYVKGKNGGDRYRIIFFNDNGSIDYSECVLFDAKTYASNLMETFQQALVVRDCPEAEEMVTNFVLTRLRKRLNYYISQQYNESPTETGIM